MNPKLTPEDEMDNTGTGVQRPPQPTESADQGARRAPQIFAAALDLPPEDAALAGELLALSESTHPDPDFVAGLEGELARKRRASLPRRVSPGWAERLRGVLQSAWGWTLPAGALIVLILGISLLLQMRPRPTIPSGQLTATPFLANHPSFPIRNPSASPVYAVTGRGYINYTVQPGDTLQSIASYFGVTVEALLRANPGVEPLIPGTSLTVNSSSIYPAPGERYYLVQPGDTIFGFVGSIAVEALKAFLEDNHLVSESLPYVGMRLTIPPSSVYPAPQDSTYVIQAGDTLQGIASRFGVRLEALLGANNLFIDIELSVGQALLIPESEQIISRPAPIIYPTPIPPGVFILRYFPPAILDYDPSVWIFDDLQAIDKIFARGLETCQLGQQGGTDYFPSPDETVTLGNITYQVGTWLDTPPGANTSYYFDWNSLTGYDYTGGWIVLTVSASPAEWEQCKVLAEQVLSSLHVEAQDAAALANQYIVQAGDTLLSIAEGLEVNIDDLLAANHLTPEAALRVGQVLIIPGGLRAALTPIPAGTPDAASQAALAELQSLVAKRRADLLTGSGWIYKQIHLSESSSGCGSLLPNGATLPCEYDTYIWAELNDRGQVVTDITRQVDPSGQVVQESVLQDGSWRNLTFGTQETGTLTYTYPTDWGFAAQAAEVLARGASLSRVSISMEGEYTGKFIVRLAEADNLEEAVFDPYTGQLLALSTWSLSFDGEERVYGLKILVEERVDQPPAEALALLDQPLLPFQSLPPQGDPVPAGFDLAYSTLYLRTINGDDFDNPSFFYGDIIADGAYLVGRVDFGAVPGGWCQRSPDGLKLAFDHITYSDQFSAVHQLRWLDLSNLSEVHIPEFELQLVSPPVWSPDSTRLAFIACDADQLCGLHVYEPGAGALLGSDAGGNAIPPVWSSSGTEIAYQTGPGEAPQTVVVDAGSLAVIASPAWHPVFPAGYRSTTACENTPAMAHTQPEPPADWLTYTNAAYGFSFRYAPDWALEELDHSVQMQQGDLKLSITFEYSGENAVAYRTGVAAGDLVLDGHVSFFGQALARRVLVYQGKTKAVLYKKAERGGVIFTLSLDDFRLDYEAVNLTAELLQQADQVIESFAWLQAPSQQPAVNQAPALVVAAQQDWVPIYAGPGTPYPQEGEVLNSTQLTPLGRTADGSWIAVYLPGYPNDTAWIPASAVSLSGSALEEAYIPPLLGSTPPPAAPPDSMRIAGRIAFISERDGYPALYEMNADGSGLIVLVNDLAIVSAGPAEAPFWSPDGQTLAFDATSRQTYDIATFVVGAGGGAWSQLDDSTYLEWAHRSSLSPDGARMWYIAGEIFVSAADGSNPVNLSGGEPSRQHGSLPAWSPDGSQLAYIAWLLDENGQTISTNMFIAAADGNYAAGTQRSLPLASSHVQAESPSWSPDGQIWRLTEDPASDYAPAWNPSPSLAPLPGPRPPAPLTPAYTAGDEELARQALETFLGSLHAGQYAPAVELYGGSYDVLVDNNFSLDPRDKAALLQNACEVNGYQCLQSNRPSLIARSRPDRYVFVVRQLPPMAP